MQHVVADPSRVAFQYRETDQENKVTSVSFGEVARIIVELSEKLNELKIGAGDRVVQISGNSFGWIVWDFALQIVGAVHVPIGTARSPQESVTLVQHCQPSLIVLESNEQLQQLKRAGIDDSVPVVLNSGSDQDNAPQADVVLGDAASPEQIRSLRKSTANIDSMQLATIIYTSGTTGRPKGVMLSHFNIFENVQSLLHVTPIRKDETRLCVLPLSHMYARTNDLYSTVSSGAMLCLGSPGSLVNDCKLFRPNFVNGVPYLFEKCMREYFDQRADQSLPGFLGGNLKAVNSGGARVPEHVEAFFWENGIPMTTGYGLTETSPVLTASSIENHRSETAGQPIPSVNLKLGEDKEILVRGPNLMMGYFREPDLTASAIVDGWFHTGDLGVIDDDGFVTITGRKDEMIVTTTGLNIFPGELESLILLHPDINQVCVVGNGKPFLTAIACLERPVDSIEQLRTEINDTLVNRSRYERIAEVVVADREFSIADGTLTQKGGLRRKEIAKRWMTQDVN